MAGHQPDDSGQRVSRGPPGPSEQALTRLEHSGDVTTAPGVGHREGRNLASRSDEELHLALKGGSRLAGELEFSRALVDLTRPREAAPVV